jgi:uncharacterized protein with HEPN domain
MNEKDKGRLIDIINFAQEALEILGATTELEFFDNRLLQRACERCLGVIGEAARHISIELSGSTPDFPWDVTKGMAVVVAHDSSRNGLGILYRTVTEKLPLLIQAAKKTIEDQENP